MTAWRRELDREPLKILPKLARRELTPRSIRHCPAVTEVAVENQPTLTTTSARALRLPAIRQHPKVEEVCNLFVVVTFDKVFISDNSCTCDIDATQSTL